MTSFERIKTGIAKKWEFVYMKDYNENDIKYPLREGKLYTIFYDKDKKEMYTDKRGLVLIRLKNHTLYSDYKKARNNMISREIYLKPYQIVLTKKLKRQKTFSRYFAKYIFDKYDRIFEIKKQDFGRKTSFYDKVSLEWQFQGSKESIILNNNKALKGAEKRLKGIRDFIDPLEFYEERMSSLEKVQKKLSNLK